MVRPEGPPVSRPGRQAGIMVKTDVSAEGAAQRSRKQTGCAGPSGLFPASGLTPRSRAGLLPAGASRLNESCAQSWVSLQALGISAGSTLKDPEGVRQDSPGRQALGTTAGPDVHPEGGAGCFGFSRAPRAVLPDPFRVGMLVVHDRIGCALFPGLAPWAFLLHPCGVRIGAHPGVRIGAHPHVCGVRLPAHPTV